jgi:hypothetical protein
MTASEGKVEGRGRCVCGGVCVGGVANMINDNSVLGMWCCVLVHKEMCV